MPIIEEMKKEFTKKVFYDILIDMAKEYRLKAKENVIRNGHMNETKNFNVSQTDIDAILVDYINFVMYKQGLDLGLYTKDLK
jgi:hypothetical protein